MSVQFESAQITALLDAARAAIQSVDDFDPVALALSLREAEWLREGSDDHFYGPWFGGSRAAGGHEGRGPTPEARRADMIAKVGPENVGVAPRERIKLDHPDKGTTADPRQTHILHSTEGHWVQKGDHREYVVDKWDQNRVDTIHASYFASVAPSTLPKSASPTVSMTGGGPASGKSRGLLQNPATGIPPKHMAAHIDPDSAKTHIPEYERQRKNGDQTAANTAHEESSHMAKTGVAIALGSGHDVVYDTVGDSGIDKLSSKVSQMRAQGAKTINSDYAYVPVSMALARAKAREEDPKSESFGRHVDPEHIANAHRDVSSTYQAAAERGIFDRMRLWDTSGPSPVLVSTTENGRTVVHVKEAWDAFRAIGGTG